MTITFTELAEFHDGTDASSYVTASYTPTANRALVVFVNVNGTAAATPTGAGNGVTWTRDFRTTWGAGHLMCVFTAFSGTSPTTGGFTLSGFGGDNGTGCTIHVVEIDGANTSDFIGQIVTASGSAATAPSTTFSPAIAATSGVYHAFGEGTSPPPNVTQPAGYTRLVNSGHTQPGVSTGVAVHSAPGAVTTVTWASTSEFAWQAVGVEILAPSGGTPITANLDQVSSTELVQALTAISSQGTAQVSESGSTGQVIGFRVSDFSSAVNVTITTDTIYPVAQVVETETAQALLQAIFHPVAQVVEFSTVGTATAVFPTPPVSPPVISPDLPSLVIEADFTTPPLVIPTNWTDLSGRATEAASIRQGRQRLLGRTEVGEASAELTNADRGLDPTVHTELKPGVHFRMRASYNDVTYDLFRGFARSWGQRWPQHVLAHVQVEAEDAFALMARYELEGESIAEMSSGDHIREVLTTYGWPPAGSIPPGKTWWRLGTVGFSELGTTTRLGESLNRIDDGTEMIMALDLEGNLLEHLLNVAERTEGGTLHMGPGGDVVFRSRPSPFDPAVAIFGDIPGELRYVDLPLDYDDVELHNDVRLTRRGDSIPSVAKDQVAIDVGTPPRTLALSDLLFATTAQADSAAVRLLARHKEPILHPRRMVLKPRPNSPLWPVVLSRELGDRITVRRRPPSGGAPIELDCLILGVTYDIKPGEWTITWDLAPAEPVLDAWYLGRVGHSELGTTTILA